ncbi:MtrB/PioB family decaheme-associated outer membrane protein [Shewanella indica]|uniref:MtrB/PioB family decaheme-associated outer membrane protein n=1 Tax=Shewanella indica TaxID=768528 RepID=UPI003D369EA8
MHMKLNLITIGLLTVSGSAMAANFSVHQANTAKVNTDAYQCNKCEAQLGASGEIGVSAGYTNTDDIRSGEHFGRGDEGAVGALNADVSLRNEKGHVTRFTAHDLGFDNGSASLSAKQSGVYQAQIDYQLLTTYDASAQTNLWHNQGLLTPSDELRNVNLGLERERIGMGVSYDMTDYFTALVDYQHETKTGNKRASLLAQSPINFVQPVDATTENVNAGFQLNGKNWSSELMYTGSFYRNDIDNLSLTYMSDVYAATPDNDAHQVSLSGQYLFDRTTVHGRVAMGRMIQDSNLIQMTGNPIQNWDGQVDTVDARLGFTTMLSPKWRLNGQLDYSDRDNESSVFEFTQLEFDSVSGSFKENVPLDIKRTGIKLQSNYRISSIYRLSGGYEYKEVERSYSERETTEDSNLWAKLSIKALDNLRFDIKGIYEHRDGSQYDASYVTSSEDNPLLRKFYLADRDRTRVEMRIHHTPLSWLSLDLIGHYSNDDYDSTEIGLTESEDYGYDLNVGFNVSNDLQGYALVGQQWITSDMAGSSNFSQPNWYSNTDDTFINFGAGMSYSGLMDDRMTLGIDYLFANSNSDTHAGGEGYGDYYSYSHNVDVYAKFALNERLDLKVDYRYERYYDTDYASATINGIPGLVTLGDLDHNYNAHLLMLTVSYKLP